MFPLKLLNQDSSNPTFREGGSGAMPAIAGEVAMHAGAGVAGGAAVALPTVLRP